MMFGFHLVMFRVFLLTNLFRCGVILNFLKLFRWLLLRLALFRFFKLILLIRGSPDCFMKLKHSWIMHPPPLGRVFLLLCALLSAVCALSFNGALHGLMGLGAAMVLE